MARSKIQTLTQISLLPDLSEKEREFENPIVTTTS